MASNRSNVKTRAAAAAAPVETPKDALAAVARQSARVQLAALTTAGTLIAGWAQAADRFARVVGESDSRELIVRVAAATNDHLHELAVLPRAAADHFDTRLSRVTINN